MFCLGKLYWAGKGVAQNRKTAIQYFHQAADAGNVEAMVMLGWVYYHGVRDEKEVIAAKNFGTARKYYQMAVDNGDDRSYYSLGNVCYDQRDYAAAMANFKKAARIDPAGSVFGEKHAEEQKSVRRSRALAMVRIGCMYRQGLGPEGVDFLKAKMWFERAAKLGEASAMNNLSMMYAVGDGVAKDASISAEWYKKYEQAAAKQ